MMMFSRYNIYNIQLLIVTKQKVQLRQMALALQVIDHKPKYTSMTSDLLVVTDEKKGFMKVIIIHPERDMKV